MEQQKYYEKNTNSKRSNFLKKLGIILLVFTIIMYFVLAIQSLILYY